MINATVRSGNSSRVSGILALKNGKFAILYSKHFYSRDYTYFSVFNNDLARYGSDVAVISQTDVYYSYPILYNSGLAFVYYKNWVNLYSTHYYFSEFQDNGTAYEQVLFDVSLFNVSNGDSGCGLSAVQTSKTLLIVTCSADEDFLILWSLTSVNPVIIAKQENFTTKAPFGFFKRNSFLSLLANGNVYHYFSQIDEPDDFKNDTYYFKITGPDGTTIVDETQTNVSAFSFLGFSNGNCLLFDFQVNLTNLMYYFSAYTIDQNGIIIAQEKNFLETLDGYMNSIARFGDGFLFAYDHFYINSTPQFDIIHAIIFHNIGNSFSSEPLIEQSHFDSKLFAILFSIFGAIFITIAIVLVLFCIKRKKKLREKKYEGEIFTAGNQKIPENSPTTDQTKQRA